MDDTDLTLVLCEILGRVPGWSWRPDGPDYGPGEVGIFYRSIDTTPDRAIGVAVYGGSDPAVYAPQRRVQLHFRGSPGDRTGADTLAGIAFLVLQDRPPGQGIVTIARTSFGPLPADGNRRQERTDNYLILLDNLEASVS